MIARSSSFVPLGCLSGLLIGLIATPAWAQPGSPSPAADRTTTAPLFLSDADSERFERQKRAIADLWRAGKYSEALEPARRALAITEEAVGPGRWQTVDARRMVETLTKVASLPREGRDAMAQTLDLDDRCHEMWLKGLFIQSERAARDLIAIRGRWLGEGHPETARAYYYLATSLDSLGKYAEAEPLLRKSLALRLERLGEAHPETSFSYRNLALNCTHRVKYPEAEVLARKSLALNLAMAGPNHVESGSSYAFLGFCLETQGKYTEAEPLFRKALEIHLKSAGEDHSATATMYQNLAANQHDQGKDAEAEPLFRRALAISLKLSGEAAPDTVLYSENLAAILAAQGKCAEAESLVRRALSVSMKTLREDDPQVVACQQRLAAILDRQGKYAESEPLLRAALASQLKSAGEVHPSVAESYHNLAINQHYQAKDAEAEPLYRKALAIQLRTLGEGHPKTATLYSNLALTLSAQRKSVEAEPLLRKVLAIRLEALNAGHPLIAESYESIAHILCDQERYAEAEPLMRKALDARIAALSEDHPRVADTYHNLAVVLDAEGKFTEAEPLLRKALTISGKTRSGDHIDMESFYHNLALNLFAQGRDRESVGYWERAAESVERSRAFVGPAGLERARRDVLPIRSSLALAQVRLGRPREAWSNWEADLARGLLDDVSARQLRPLTADQRRREADLLGQVQAIDERIGKLIARPDRTQAEDQGLDALRRQESEIRGRYVAMENELMTEYRTFGGKPATLEEVQEAIPADAALIGWVDVDSKLPRDFDRSSLHWACVIRHQGDPIWVRTQATGNGGAWSEEDEDRPEAVRTALRENQPAWRERAEALARQRLGPLSPHLGGVRRLIVLPSPSLAGIPIEALMDAQPPEQPRVPVSYAPSGSMLARLTRPKSTPAGPPHLLALGDPAYLPPAPQATPPSPPDHGIALLAVVSNGTADLAGLRAGDVILKYDGRDITSAGDLKIIPADAGARSIPVEVWRDGETRVIEVAAGPLGIRFNPGQTASQILLARRDADTVLKPLTRGESWDRLPGTRREVEVIVGLFPPEQSTALLGDRATEPALQGLAATGRLKSYRYIHLATHGRADSSIAMNSALMLAPAPTRPSDPLAADADGRITAQQIVNTWDLDADLVVLSACQTGLGKYAGGEGYLGFSQALFVKGARSVVLSLWEVNDDSTHLLMQRFYQNLLGRRDGLTGPMVKSEALDEAKRWLRTLTVEQVAGLTRSDPRRPRPANGTPSPARRSFDHPYFWAGFILIGDPT